MDICKLGDIAKFTTGKLNSNAAQNNGRYPFFTCAPESLRIDEYAFDTEAIILAGNNAEGNFHIQYFKGKFNAYQRTYVIESLDENKVYTKYLYYALKTCLLHFKQISQGSATKFLTTKILNSFELPIPEINIQKKVAGILGNLDEKIEANTAINENLYIQAQAIKKQWVTTNEDGYQLLPLADVATINSDTYSIKEAWMYVNYLDTSSIANGVITDIQRIVPSNEKLPSRARRKVAAGDVLFSTVRPNQNHFGIISDPLPNMLVSTGFAVIRSKNPLVCNELIYLCITEMDFIKKMQQLAEQSTSTFPSIKPSDLGTCQIPCPKDEKSAAFIHTLKCLFNLIAINLHENNSLATMRDTLLPKLMSGEIDVSVIQL